jgi:putative SOS response-associated peptidase YedK
MCGRFTLTDPDPRLLRLRFDLSESAEIRQEPRYNVAPTDPVLAVRVNEQGEREPGRLRWGLIPGKADPDDFSRNLINARAETIAKAAPFKDAFHERRCLVVADGFFEWKATETGKHPVWITRPERELFAFAGIWASSRREDGSAVHSCAIITCEPSKVVAPIHDRMPVILAGEAEEVWLDRDREADDLLAVLQPSEDLVAAEVSEKVNDVRFDGPELIEPPLRLF